MCGGGDVLSNLIEYSTQERRIGTWIDGKPVYRKVFTGSFGKNGYPLGISNLRNIIHIYGAYQAGSIIEGNNGNAVFPIPCPRIAYPTRHCDIFMRHNNFYFELGADISSKYHFILVIEYIKN